MQIQHYCYGNTLLAFLNNFTHSWLSSPEEILVKSSKIN